MSSILRAKSRAHQNGLPIGQAINLKNQRTIFMRGDRHIKCKYVYYVANADS